MQQQLAMLVPTDDEPVMLALSPVEGKAEADIDSTVAESLSGVEVSKITENRYLAMVAEGKLKPFATTAMLSQGTGVPEFSPSDSLPQSSALSTQDSSGADMDPIYTYDLNGNRTSMIDPTGLTTYTYDVLNRLTSITNNQGRVTSFTYDALGRRTSMTHANGVVTSYTYDAASQLTTLAHQLGVTPINSFVYTYDKVGNRKTKVDQSGPFNYTYDTLNRLTQALNPLPSNPLETFTYDGVGNRTNSNQNGASSFNQVNQLLEDANFTYQYDNNGNLTLKTPKSPGPFTSYEYDAENKLVRAVTNGTTANYKYDGLGRRVEKEVINVGTTVTRYVYDNEDILLELNNSNTIVARYTHGPGIDEPLIKEKNSQSFYYHADGLGTITELTNQSGTVVQRYTYSSFGKIESLLDPNFIQPYTFTSREFDPETGIYNYRERYYDPTIGRFLNEDPIGFKGGFNLYGYVENNPVVWSDPSGLLPHTIVQQNGVIVEHYGLKDHGPAHAHVKGGGPEEVKIGPQGYPLKNEPELSPKQRKVVRDNKKQIRKELNKLGRLRKAMGCIGLILSISDFLDAYQRAEEAGKGIFQQLIEDMVGPQGDDVI